MPLHFQVRAHPSLVVAACAVLLLSAPAEGQVPASNPAFTLGQAIQYAAEHYPTIRAATEQVNASAAGVDIAHSTYLPRLDSLWQSNRATANNMFGQVLPQSVIPSLTGPVLPSASSESVWGSATGALVSWEAFDFGLRHAGVVSAEATLTHSRASEALARLDVENAVAQAFLSVLAAQRAAAAAQSDLDRRNVLLQSVQVLVNNQLRPGAEASRADAERAAAQTRLIQAQQTLLVAQTMLTRMLGGTVTVVVAGDALLARLPPPDVEPSVARSHPLLQVRQAEIDQARAREEVLARTDRPRVFLQSSLFARGSGADPDGTLDGGINGLGLQRANWAAGVQVLFPNLFDFSNLRAQKTQAAATFRASAALYDEALLTTNSDRQIAAAMLQSARAIAANTPVELAAAQQSEVQARARYDAGLASVVEVAYAQTLLAQAEEQDQLARVNVWRAALAAAVAQGDLTSFIRLISEP